jgi:hypothetical protein
LFAEPAFVGLDTDDADEMIDLMRHRRTELARMDVEDIASLFGKKYQQGLQEMQNYAHRLLQ